MAIKVTFDENINNPKVKVLMLKGEKGEQGDVNLAQLNAEITTRANADNNLQSQINGLASGSPLVASSISEMTDTTRVYVNTTDGHWYWYDGSNWQDGGVYQSTGIQTDPTLSINGMAADGFVTGYIKNIVNSLDTECNLFDGKYLKGVILTNGVYNDNNDCRTAIIKAEPNTKYFIEKYDTSSRFRVATYSSYPKHGDTGVLKIDDFQNYHYEFTTSNNENYLAVCVSNSSEEPRLVITKNSQDRLINYGESKLTKNTDIFNLKSSLSDYIVFNLFDEDYITNKGFLRFFNGSYYYEYNYSGIVQKSGTVRTAVIKVEPNTKYYIKVFGTHGMFRVGESENYPQAGDELNPVTTETVYDEYNFTTSNNANYMVITLDATDNNPQLCVTKGYYVNKYLSKDEYIILDKENNLYSKDFYFLDSFNQNYSCPNTVEGGSVNDTVNLINSNPSVITDIYDDLVSEYPTNVTKTLLGTASGYSINQYDFSFAEIQNTTSYSIKKPKICIVAGIHGYEQGSCWALAQFMDLLTRNTDNQILNAIKNNVDFSIVPVANPYGFAHNQRKNENGIDINRNFDANFVPSGDPTSEYYGGTTAGSEDETQILVDFIENNQDAIVIIDYHNIASGYPLYYAYDNMQVTLANAVFTSLSTQWKEIYSGLPNEVLGKANNGVSVGAFSWYAITKVGVSSFTLETPWIMPYIGQTQYDKNTIMTAVDVLANTIIALIKNI